MLMTHHEHEWVNDRVSYATFICRYGSECLSIQRGSEEALRASEARYRAIVEDHQTELMCQINPELRINLFSMRLFVSIFKNPGKHYLE